MAADERAASAIVFDADGQPRSRRFGDVYHSRDGGLAQARQVFLDGCGLPHRWEGRRRFTVAELGFGTGLNVLALLDLWLRRRPPGASLAIFSVEAEPIGAADARRALGAYPEVAPLAEWLLRRWPSRRAGFQRVDLPGLSATLDVAVMEAAEALEGWSGAADAWLLDGFSPAMNPDMWSARLMSLVARRAAPGARLATWSVAGPVRRALAGAGFLVERRAGFGSKRERLEAYAPGVAEADAPDPRVAIVGAGVAGASLARAFRALGAPARVLEREAAGAGGSGNPAALVTPRLDAGLGPVARLHAQAFERAWRLYEDLGEAVIARGVLQLETQERDARRFSKIAASELFEPDSVRPISGEEAARRMGEPAGPALELARALVIEPRRALDAWLGGLETETVASLAPRGGAWALIGAEGRDLGTAEVVCLATGAELGRLWSEAPIAAVRGQLSWVDGPTAPAAAWGPYVAPTRQGLMFGATHDRGQTGGRPSPADDRRNLAVLALRFPALAERAAAGPLRGRAAIRATTADRLPLAGEVAPGLFVLGGLGARGFTLAPLLAEHLAALALGAPSPLPEALAQIVRPERFVERAARRATGGRGTLGPMGALR